MAEIQLANKKNKTITKIDGQGTVYRLALDYAAEHIIITEKNGCICYANPAVTEVTGFEHDAIIGQKAGGRSLWGGLMPPAFYADLWQQINSGQLFSGEIQNRRKNGELYWAEVRISPVYDQTGEIRYFVGIERDITEIKQKNEMKNDFTSLVSHQLLTPMSTIKWNLDTYLEETREQDTFRRQLLENTYLANERMIELVDLMLEVTRLDRQDVRVQVVQTDLAKVLSQIVDFFDAESRRKGQTVSLAIEADSMMIGVDPKLIRNVLQNLLSNAIKYTPEQGSIHIKAEEAKPDKMRVSIFDTGIGVPESVRPHLFERYFRADEVKQAYGEGLGLGLYIAKTFTEMWGGEIGFEPNQPIGSIFWITIPFKKQKT